MQRNYLQRADALVALQAPAFEEFLTLEEGSVGPACPYAFTKSEKEILIRLAAGKSMASIAHEKHISLDTLKKHRNNILQSGRPEYGRRTKGLLEK